MALGSKFGENELFTTEDIKEITGESKEELTERIEQYREELAQMGLNPDDYFKPVQEKQTFYFPHGLTS